MMVENDDMDEGWKRDTNKGTDKKECGGGVDNDKMGKMGEGTVRNELTRTILIGGHAENERMEEY